jgi:hypothetical protein
MSQPLFRILLLAGTPLITLGCMSQQNDRGYLGVDPVAVAPVENIPTNAGNGLNRDQWEPTVVFIPVDGTAHPPTYNGELRPTRVTARQRGEYPTVEQALELSEDSLGAQVQEVPMAIGAAIVDGASIPGGLIVYPQSLTRWSPSVSYERSPRPATRTDSLTAASAVDVHETLQEVPQGTATPGATTPPTTQPNRQPANPPASQPVSQPIGQMTPVRTAE